MKKLFNLITKKGKKFFIYPILSFSIILNKNENFIKIKKKYKNSPINLIGVLVKKKF